MSSLRRTASLAAFVVLAAQATGIVHLAVAPHDVCPLDGAIVERGAGAAPAAAAPGRQSHAAPGGSAHEHESCLAIPGDDPAVEPRVAHTPIAFVVRLAPAAPTRELHTARGPPLYLLAPKTSPPA